MTWERFGSQLSKRVTKLEQLLANSTTQRRDYITDINGTELWDYGDAGTPASFEFFLPPDLREFMRYEIRLRIKRFRMPISNAPGSGETRLTISGNERDGYQVSPNPHSHPVEASVSEVNSTPSDFTISIDGYDYTEEAKGTFTEWPTGFGSFPENSTFDFKLLAENVAPWKRGVLLSSGVKNIKIGSNDLFECRLVLYLKYSHKGRGGVY